MSLSLAIALNLFLCLSLLAGLARVMALAARLTPHRPASQTEPVTAPAAAYVVIPYRDKPLADARRAAEIAAAR
jgi:hypothetical protein